MTMENQTAVRELLEKTNLKPRTKEMILLRFGFYGTQETYAEIGAKFNICQERARQIIARGLRDLRVYFIKVNKFKFEDFFEPEEI